MMRCFTGKLDFFKKRILLRPQEINNRPEIVRRLGIVSMNTAIEVDLGGNVNSTQCCPQSFESCDLLDSHRGPQPRFWQYVKHAACHWIVNFALRLATLAEPRRCWRIISSDFHSTVWDGAETLFDFNYQALGEPPTRQLPPSSSHACPNISMYEGFPCRTHFAVTCITPRIHVY